MSREKRRKARNRRRKHNKPYPTYGLGQSGWVNLGYIDDDSLTINDTLRATQYQVNAAVVAAQAYLSARYAGGGTLFGYAHHDCKGDCSYWISRGEGVDWL